MNEKSTISGSFAGPRYEVRDVTVWRIVLLGVGLVVVLVLALGGSDVLVSLLASHDRGGSHPSASAVSPPPPKPVLQPDPHRDLVELRRSEDARLHSYQWIDRRTGVVRIPIDRAMDLVAAQGLGPSSEATHPAQPASPQPPR
jgi:hypothetical protein